MADVTPVNSKALAPAIGPYAHAVVAGGFVFLSGQVALLPDGTFAGGSVEQQTRQVITNLKTVLEEVGSSLRHVTKMTVYLKSMDDFAQMNKVYAEEGTPWVQMLEGHTPARATIEISRLPKDALVEIDAIALVKPKL